MLDWLTGSANVDESSDEERPYPDDDAPATPAPLFALRAFQHAIYGTPKPGANAPKPTQKSRKKTSGLESWLPESGTKDNKKSSPKTTKQIPASPSKPPGILLTPGTAGNRRKTVSFGSYADRKRDREVTNSLLPATPREAPGRFPTPQQQHAVVEKESLAPRGLSSEEQKVNPEVRKKAAEAKEAEHSVDITVDVNVPHSSSGQYWKSEFDNFSAKSSSEIRKLVKKEQLAKKYAKHRDDEAVKLAGLLEKQQQRVAELEEQVSNYVQQLSSAVNRQVGSKSSSKEDVGGDSRAKEVSELKSALQAADTKTKTFENEMKSLKLSLEETSKEAKLLERENMELREDLENVKRTAALKPAIPPEPVPSSDIWADNEELLCTRKVRSHRPSNLTSRSPLRPRHENTVPMNETMPRQTTGHSAMTEDWKEVARKRMENSSSMPASRREAALKRIEERKNNRLNNNT